MSTIKKQFLRQSKNLTLQVLCETKMLSLQGPVGSFLYPLNTPLKYSKIEKKLYLLDSLNSDKNRSLSKLYSIMLVQASLGVLLGYRKQLNIVGIGYQASVENVDNLKYLVLKLGFSHQVRIRIPDYLEIICPKPRVLILKGLNLQKINNFAAVLRKLKLPFPYKEKGIYFSDERPILKQGKKT